MGVTLKLNHQVITRKVHAFVFWIIKFYKENIQMREKHCSDF